MSGPVNAIMGDDFVTDLPVIDVPQSELAEERRKAKFSRTAEFKKLKEHLEERIRFYQGFLPGNTPVVAVAEEERGKYWAVADLVVAELKGVISAYENAAEVVREADNAR